MRQRVSLFFNLTDAADTNLHSGPCILERVTVNEAAAGDIVLFHNTEASGDTVASIGPFPAIGTYEYGAHLPSGLTVSTGAAHNLTVIVTGLGGTATDPDPESDGGFFLLESGDLLLLETSDILALE